jgi:hypothetical protein
MSDPGETAPDTEPATDEDLASLGAYLRDARPQPSSTFRQRLLRTLEYGALRDSQPEDVWPLIIRYAAAGAVLLAIGAISAAGAGPLGG